MLSYPAPWKQMLMEDTMVQRWVNLWHPQKQYCTNSICQPVVCIDNTSNIEDVNNQTTDKDNGEEKDCNNNEEEEEESNLVTPTTTPACCPPTNIVTKQWSSKGSHASWSSNNTESMVSVLAEIRRETEEALESNETVAWLPNSAANHLRATHASGSTSTARHGNGRVVMQQVVRTVIIQS